MSAPKAKIVIIDDDPIQGKLIERILKGDEYSITHCHDAESALVLLGKDARETKKAAFDLVICDFMLPGMDGFQTVEFLRRSEHGKTTPILFISAHGYALRNRAIKAGADAFMAKPVDPAKLRTQVHALLKLE
ncbi:MAG TPA: response regulator [Candidatus Acidoferrales bacterium]|nr:response regulator [Candidatus Acidoferrales bacterium]